MTTLFNDLKFAIRQLRKTPGFTAVAVLTLALAIGATTAITSVVRTALFDPLPMAHPERFLRFVAKDISRGGTDVGLNQFAAREVQDATKLFRTVALSEPGILTVADGEVPRLIGTWQVTEGFFRLFRIPPLLGRLPTSDDFRPDADGVLVLGHRAWRSEFGGDPDIVGRTLPCKRGLITVIGVMPSEFRFPSETDAWVPWSVPIVVMAGNSRQDNPIPWLTNTRVAVELRPGVTREQAQAWLDVLQARQAQSDQSQRDYKFLAQDLSEMFSRPELRRTLWVLFAMTLVVLLIASANVANLQLVRTETRRQEMSVRVAVGASRGRVFRQLLVESLLLATLGGLAGLLATWFGLDLLTKLLPAQLPRLRAIQLDWSVLALGSLVTLATGVLFGVAPAWRGGEANVSETLKLGSRGAGGGPQRQRFIAALVIGQLVLAVILLTGAGLMVRTVHKLLNVDLGFDPVRLVKIHSRSSRNLQGPEVVAMYDDLRARLAALPGVEAVGLIQPNVREIEVTTGKAQERFRLDLVNTGEADPLRAMRARLTSGRWLQRSDAERSDAVILNETAARRLWPGKKAVGRRIRLKDYGEVEVVGVIADLREYAYDEDPTPTFYALRQRNTFNSSPHDLVTRTTVPYNALRTGIERESKAADPDHSRLFLQFMDEELYRSTAGDRTFMMYLLAFAATGLGLAALGLYGILSFRVALRTREIGIRMALGATRHEVTQLIVAQGMRLVAAGVGLGLVGALAATQWLRSFLFGIAPSDPVTLATVATLLVLVSLLACWLPARRASKTDPMAALRYE